MSMTPRFMAALIALAALLIPARAADKRSNILFAFADDWGRYASAYAALEPGGINDVVQTPNFDRVAGEGVLFTHAFVNAPSCTPCRSSLLSGQHFFRTRLGAILQGAIWDESIPTYPLILAEQGYAIGHSNKVWSPGTPANAPYGAREYAHNDHGNRFNRFSQFVSGADDHEAAKQQLFDEVRSNFQDFLNTRDRDQPFCYWWGPTNCHRKWIQGSGNELWGIDPDSLQGKVPPFLPDVEIVRQDIADYLGEVQAFDAGLGVLLNELERIAELDNTIIVVSGDHGMPGFPRGKCNLYDFGVAVALAIRWGDGVKTPGRVVDDFVSLPDLAPTFLQVAGAPLPATMTAQSLLPVLQSNSSGHVDAARDHVIVGRERHVAAARLENLPYPQRAIRTKDFLYIRNFEPQRWPMGVGPGFGLPEGPLPDFEALQQNTFAAFGDLDASPTKAWIAKNCLGNERQRFFDLAFERRPEEELYDLREDPHQLNNVAQDAQYSRKTRELSARLLAILRDNGDPRVLGAGDTFDNPPYAGPVARAPRRGGDR